MFQITSDYNSEKIPDWCVFLIGFKLVSDWVQIVTKNFRFLQIASYSFQTGSLEKNISDWQSKNKIIFGCSPKKLLKLHILS